MSDLESRLAKLSPAQRALFEKRAKLQSERQPATSHQANGDPRRPAEPIAIVGLACRLPGGATLDEYWQTILSGQHAISETPPDRWDTDALYDPDGGPGKLATRWGGFLRDLDQFDPRYFGITPREANRMDPQQRLLLEVASEALEHAGVAPDALAGTATGVYVGIGGNDYSKVPVHQASDYFGVIDGYMGTGNALSIAANRLSYLFDLKGPSLAIDTACSSSSVAICLAVEALRRGECTAAIAAGVNAILTPETTIAFSNAQMLSPHGRCRPFDAAADGYVRGEGCGVVVLKRLADAQRDGDHVVGVLRAAAMNQDGRTSGISAPNGESQKRCLQAALDQARLATDDITYIEAHGTGTPLGDPIEMRALADLFRQNEKSTPLRVASVKANIGHTETVSGIAGLIKVALMLRHGVIPPHAGFESLNPHIDLTGSRIEVPREETAWQGVRRAGVSSFGFGGANAHLIVEAPEPARKPTDNGAAKEVSSKAPRVVKLSAKSPEALAREAGDLAEWLGADASATLDQVAYAAGTARGDFAERATIVAENRSGLESQLAALAAGQPDLATRRGTVSGAGRRKAAMLFSGQGAQYACMGRELYDSNETFRREIDRCDKLLTNRLDEPLLEVLFGEKSEALINQTVYTQPALFAVSYALAAVWKSWGVEPDLVAGHSIGEYAAATIAGVMTLEDAVRLVAERGRLMQQAPLGGKMAAVFATEEVVVEAISGREDCLALAAVNSPEGVVLSGEAVAVDAVLKTLASGGVEHRMLAVSHAFHSPMMDEVLDDFEAFASTITYRAPKLPLASNLTGELMTAAPTARYWRDHLRGAVRFADNAQALHQAGATRFIEVGPGASLLGMAKRTLAGQETDAEQLSTSPSLRKGMADAAVLAGAVADHYAGGGRIDWRRLTPRPDHRPWLPTYPFERMRCWIEGVGEGSLAPSRLAPSTNAPLLGVRAPAAWSSAIFESTLTPRSPAYLADHAVGGSVVVPAAAYLEQALQAAEQAFGEGHHTVADLRIGQAMFLDDAAPRRVQVTLAPESGGSAEVAIASQPADDPAAAWTEHATARVSHGLLVEDAEGESREDGKVTPFSMSPSGGAGPSRRQGERLGDGVALGTRLATVDLVPGTTPSPSPSPCRGGESESPFGGNEPIASDDFYEKFARRGFAYGPGFRMIDSVAAGEGAALAELVATPAVEKEKTPVKLHPVWGDACLQTLAAAVESALDTDHAGATYMPVAITAAQLVGDAKPARCVARLTSDDAASAPDTLEGDAWLLDENNEPVAQLRGIRLQRTTAAGAGATGPADWRYEVTWRPAPLADKPADAAGVWLLVGGRELASDLAARLEAAGGRCVVVQSGDSLAMRVDDQTGRTGYAADLSDESQITKILETVTATPGARLAGVVHAAALDTPAVDLTEPGDWPAASDALLHGAVNLVRQLARRQAAERGVWFVTHGAQATGHEPPDQRVAVEQSPLLGLVRVAQNEHPELSARLIDLESAASEALFDELTRGDAEAEVAYRDGQRLTARLGHRAHGGAATDHIDLPAAGAYQLRIPRPGTLEALRYEAFERAAPGPGQVELEVHAAGLNFSDVLKALGLYPGVKDKIVPLGIEASGVVTAVGEGVDSLAVGDEVFGVAPYAFGSHAVTGDYALAKKPAGVSHAEAATLPITYLTAHHALVRLAQLAPGERVLIHAGAGGVGLAAIQIAQRIGAEVFATAGSDAKRDYLRGLGVEHVYNSRTLEFHDQILADTGREGIDVVLNSLPGEAIPKSLALLRAYGRFLEIGKTDIYQDRRLGLAPFQDNLSYFAIDLDRVLRQRPEYIRGLMREVVELIAEGVYRPLESTIFPVDQTPAALRYMSQRKNIGKVIVEFESGTQVAAGKEAGFGVVRQDGAYLITGGLGALGLQVAHKLADEGAGALALVGRREPSADALEAIAEIKALGAQVVCLRADATDAESITQAIESLIEQDLPPLRGVVHAAGVLADGLIAQMPAEALGRAVRPKAAGAWNLHNATREAPLDFFLMFSSVASVLGSPGQANYAAGNAALDALAHARRRAGLPATSINWGPWAASGMAASEDRAAALESRGTRLLPTSDALDAMIDLIELNSAPQTVVLDADWAAMRRALGDRPAPLLEDLLPEADATDAGSGVDVALRRRLVAAPPADRQAQLQQLVRHDLARVMSVSPEGLDTAQPLAEFGIDSLMSLELKNGLERRLGVTLPMAKLLEGPSIDSLANEVGLLLTGGDTIAEAIDEWKPLAQLRPGEGPPVFLLPTLGGDILCYRELVAALAADCPVYAFRPRGLDDAGEPHAAMEDLARDYVEAIQSEQPAGPYRLAGWSTGGVPAVAVAERLEREGHEVSLVALFDTPPPSTYQRVDVEDEVALLHETMRFAGRFSGVELGLTADELRRLPPAERYPAAIAAAQRAGMVQADISEDQLRRMVAVGVGLIRACAEYRAGNLAAPVALFRPAKGGALPQLSASSAAEDNGWRGESGLELKVDSIDGDHFSMMTGEGARQLAERLGELLTN